MSGTMRMVSIVHYYNLYFISHLIVGAVTTTPVLSPVVRLVEFTFQAAFCQ